MWIRYLRRDFARYDKEAGLNDFVSVMGLQISGRPKDISFRWQLVTLIPSGFGELLARTMTWVTTMDGNRFMATSSGRHPIQ